MRRYEQSNRVWIGIGSNLLDPKKQVDCAIEAISKIPKSRLIARSSYYRSKPLESKFIQPYFLNTVAILDTSLSPNELLNYMQYIEKQQGRVRNVLSYWEPRTLDLDILLFGKYKISKSKLIIPHYDMLNRNFVIFPLMELNPSLILPDGVLIKDVISVVPKTGLSLWKD